MHTELAYNCLKKHASLSQKTVDFEIAHPKQDYIAAIGICDLRYPRHRLLAENVPTSIQISWCFTKQNSIALDQQNFMKQLDEMNVGRQFTEFYIIYLKIS